MWCNSHTLRMGNVHGQGDYGNFRITSDCCPEEGIRNVEAVTNHSVPGVKWIGLEFNCEQLKLVNEFWRAHQPPTPAVVETQRKVAAFRSRNIPVSAIHRVCSHLGDLVQWLAGGPVQSCQKPAALGSGQFHLDASTSNLLWRGCKNFCVNGQLAGNCCTPMELQINDRHERTDRQPAG